MKHNQSRSTKRYPSFHIKITENRSSPLHLFDEDKDLGYISQLAVINLVKDVIENDNSFKNMLSDALENG